MRITQVLVMGFGGASAAIFFTAGKALIAAGQDLNRLRSIGGESLAEAYYQSVGNLAQGGGLACYGMSAFTLALAFGVMGMQGKK